MMSQNHRHTAYICLRNKITVFKTFLRKISFLLKKEDENGLLEKKQIRGILWVERQWVLLLFTRTLCFTGMSLIIYLMNLTWLLQKSKASWSELKNV